MKTFASALFALALLLCVCSPALACNPPAAVPLTVYVQASGVQVEATSQGHTRRHPVRKVIQEVRAVIQHVFHRRRGC